MNTNVDFKCPGHCYGITKCPYAELICQNGKVVSIKCRLPRLIVPDVWISTNSFEQVSVNRA